MSASLRGPKKRSRTRAMLTSTSGCGLSKQNRRTALAMYCPTPGKASISSRVEGKRPFLAAMAAARALRRGALCAERPIGLRRASISSTLAVARVFQDEKRERKAGQKAATVSALVRWRRTSETTWWKREARARRQGNWRRECAYHLISALRKNWMSPGRTNRWPNLTGSWRRFIP